MTQDKNDKHARHRVFVVLARVPLHRLLIYFFVVTT